MATPTARPSSTGPRPLSAATDDRALARRASAGDGEAFAALYDRHERRVFGFCLRMLGAPDDAAEATQETFMRLLKRLPALGGREVNPIAYALSIARNVCYDAIAARRRAEPVAEQVEPGRASTPADVEREPERAALLAATREDVRAANARLPERQREALALRELEQLSYGQIGEIVGLSENAVAQLISRARIGLRDLLRSEALESIAVASSECERALALLARRQDGQREGEGSRAWLSEHVIGCETCRLRRAAMQEAGVSYRALGPIVPLVWLRHATIARAAEYVGADWSHLAGSGHGADPGPVQSAGSSPGSGSAPGSRTDVFDGAAQDAPTARGAAGTVRSHGPRLRLLSVTCAICAILAAVLIAFAGSISSESRIAPRNVGSVSDLAPTGQHPPGVPVRDPQRAPAKAVVSARAPRAGGSAPVLASPSGAAAGTSAPVVHGTRHTVSRRPPHHVPHRPAQGGGSPPPKASTPVASTPAPTTPAPNPPSTGTTGSAPTTGETQTTTPAETPTTPSGPSGGKGGEPPPETPPCALAIACR